jgi:hypothetical protein
MDYNNVLYDEMLANLTDEKIAVSGKKCIYFVPLTPAYYGKSISRKEWALKIEQIQNNNYIIQH